MLSLVDISMYFQYAKKNLFLWCLKTFKNLDYLGRIESTDDRLRGYEGCYPVKSLWKHFSINEKDSILDIGCGKGLFLYYARTQAFKSIDGIDYSKELIDVAIRNNGILNDNRIHVYKEDVRDFHAYDEYNYFFINNPFGKELMNEVADQLVKSIYRKKRKITVIYQFPFSIEAFVSRGFEVVYNNFPNSILIFTNG